MSFLIFLKPSPVVDWVFLLVAHNISVMPRLQTMEKKVSESYYKNIFVNRKEHSLSLFDVALFGYLCFLSRTRVFIQMTVSELAEDIHEPYSKVAKSIQVFTKLDFIRRVQYKENKGLMISPFIINNGDDKSKRFKHVLWDKFDKKHS